MSLTVKGTQFKYTIDTEFVNSRYGDGFIARGTESIVFKGKRKTCSVNRENIEMDCVLKFKRKGLNDSVLNRFKNKDLKLFNDLQGCRSVVRIFDLVEDLDDFELEFTHVDRDNRNSPEKTFKINKEEYFCVVEEYIEGKTLEEFCLEYRSESYGGFPLVCKTNSGLIHFHQYEQKDQKQAIDSYNNYEIRVDFQSKIFEFMIKLCDILEFLHKNRILHLDIKPDNIMITNAGDELVLIDFGRANYMENDENYVEAYFDVENSDEYGTVGFAAPEAYRPNNSKISFNRQAIDNDINKTKLTIESDIFSFGATFWECLSLFTWFTDIREFARKNELGYHYQLVYDTSILLSDETYCDRDLSTGSMHYHEKLERIIRKCTRRRFIGYQSDSLYYHNYDDLRKDILYAKASAPTTVKTESTKVRNIFYVSGAMLGLMCTTLIVSLFLKFSGSYFAQRKIDSITSNYYPAILDRLESAAIEKILTSNESEKHSLYNTVYDLLKNDNTKTENEDNYDSKIDLRSDETDVLVNLLTNMDDDEFVADAIDQMLLDVNDDDLSKTAKDIVMEIHDCDSIGYTLAEQLHNAQSGVDLSFCYSTLTEHSSNSQFGKLVQRLAKALDTYDIIQKIAIEELPQEIKQVDHDSLEYINAIAEKKKEIKNVLDSITRRE